MLKLDMTSVPHVRSAVDKHEEGEDVIQAVRDLGPVLGALPK